MFYEQTDAGFEILSNDLEKIEKIFQSYYPEYKFKERFKESVIRFLIRIGFEETRFAMQISCETVPTASQVIKYFCGVCWNIVRDDSVEKI